MLKKVTIFIVIIYALFFSSFLHAEDVPTTTIKVGPSNLSFKNGTGFISETLDEENIASQFIKSIGPFVTASENSIDLYFSVGTSQESFNEFKDMFVGAIVAFGNTPPTSSGFLVCDGSSVSTQNYPDLFDKIGYSWGGSGANFNLPDLRERFLFNTTMDPIGAGDRYIDSSTFKHKHRLNISLVNNQQTLQHSHTLTSGFNAGHTGEVGGDDSPGGNVGNEIPAAVSSIPDFKHGHKFTVALSNTNPYGSDAEFRPINASVVYCIGYKLK